MFSLLNQNPPVLKVHCGRIEMNASKEQKPISFVERWILQDGFTMHCQYFLNHFSLFCPWSDWALILVSPPGDFHILYSFLFHSTPCQRFGNYLLNLICDICETYFKASLSCNLEVFWAIFYPLGFAQSLAKAAASSWQKSFELIKLSGKIQSKIYLIWQSWSNISKKTQNIFDVTLLLGSMYFRTWSIQLNRSYTYKGPDRWGNPSWWWW